MKFGCPICVAEHMKCKQDRANSSAIFSVLSIVVHSVTYEKYGIK